jgi:drug/metabolite transporter (DMT)-like permease
MIGATAAFVVMGVLGAEVSKTIHPIETGFFRNVFGLMFILPWMLHTGLRALRTRHIGLHVSRAACVYTAMVLWFWALTLMPIAEVMALGFTVPLFATAGAALLLSERVGPRRWAAVGVGFCGMLIILRPGAEAVSPAALMVLGNAALIAGSVLIVKRVSASDNANAIVFYQAAFMTLLSIPPTIWVWTWPPADMWPALVGIGFCGTAAQTCFVRSLAAADASAVMPFDFFKLLFAAAAGFALTGHVPDVWTWLGAATIFGATWFTTATRKNAAPVHNPPGPGPG